MNYDDTVYQQLKLLGEAVTPDATFTDDVMSRVSQARIAPSWPPGFRSSKGSLLRTACVMAAACLIGVVAFTVLPFGRDSESSAPGWWLGPASAYAEELATALDKALPEGVVAREQTTFLFPDGSRHTSSTVNTLFLSSDRYRRDIYDDNRLRESQWYVPNTQGLTQTSVRFDTHDYQVDQHLGSEKDVDHVALLRSIVKAAGRADRRLDPREIEGQQCVGFEISAGKLNESKGEGNYRIWFDAETKLPARIEIDLPTSDTPAAAQGIRGMVFVLDRFDWNPRFPGNTFSLAIPEGFKEARN